VGGGGGGRGGGAGGAGGGGGGGGGGWGGKWVAGMFRIGGMEPGRGRPPDVVKKILALEGSLQPDEGQQGLIECAASVPLADAQDHMCHAVYLYHRHLRRGVTFPVAASRSRPMRTRSVYRFCTQTDCV